MAWGPMVSVPAPDGRTTPASAWSTVCISSKPVIARVLAIVRRRCLCPLRMLPSPSNAPRLRPDADDDYLSQRRQP